MKNKANRFLSIFLAFMMVLTLLPGTALAERPTSELTQVENVNEQTKDSQTPNEYGDGSDGQTNPQGDLELDEDENEDELDGQTNSQGDSELDEDEDEDENENELDGQKNSQGDLEPMIDMDAALEQPSDLENFIGGLIPEDIEMVFPTGRSSLRGTKNLLRNGLLPTSYDTRSKTQTSVKNQGKNGICWTFGTYAALEAYMKKNDMGVQDFSELHMAHSTSQASVGSEYGFSRPPYDGGNRLIATAYLMRSGVYAGTVDEWDDPYENIFTQIKPRNASITADKDRTYRVKNAVFLSEAYPGDRETEAAAIKRAIIDYGGVGASMYWYGNAVASPDPNVSSTKFFNADTAAYYLDGSKVWVGYDPDSYNYETNHLVEIAGWDDNYSVENFNETCRPENPGAWLVKNSWGNTWGENGYVWISYEDTNFPRSAFYFDGVEPFDRNYTIYDYDKRSDTNVYLDGTDTYVRRFQVNSGGEKLTAVKVFVCAPATIQVDAFIDLSFLEDDVNPFDEESHASKGEIVAKYPGWYEIPLNEPLSLGKAGSDFAIAFKMDWRPYVPLIGADNNNAPRNTCYTYYYGSWQDIYDCNLAMKAITESTEQTGYSIDITGGEAYSDSALTNEITDALAGDRVYIQYDEPAEGKYISNISCTPNTSVIRSTPSSPRRLYVTMPNKDITVTVESANRTGYTVNLTGGSVQVPESIFANKPIEDRIGMELQSLQEIDLNGDGTYDIEVLQRDSSSGMMTVKKHYETDLGGNYEAIPDSSNTPYSKVTYQFGAAPSVIRIKAVRVDGYETPIIGNKASDHLNLTVPIGSHYSIRSKRWYNDTTKQYLEDTDVFQEGNLYSCEIYFQADDGCELVSYDDLGYYVNGETRLIAMVSRPSNAIASLWTRSQKPVAAPPPATQHEVTLNAEPAAGGTLTGAGNYEENTNVTVTATANDGYVFTGWYNGDSLASSSASYTFKLTDDVTLTAKFNRVINSVTVPITEPVKGKGPQSHVLGTDQYNEGSISWSPNDSPFKASTEYSATVILSAKKGYVFADDAAVNVAEGVTGSVTSAVSGDGRIMTIDVTFPATDDRTLTGITVTGPTNKNHVHGDTLKSDDLVVKAQYDESPEETITTGYTVTYNNGNYLKKGDTTATVSYGDKTATVSDLNVAAKELKVTGLTATNRAYDGKTNVTLTGGELVGVVEGEEVSANMPTVGTITDPDVDRYFVNIGDISLAGTDAGNYTLEKPKVTVIIFKATPTKEFFNITAQTNKTYDGKAATVAAPTLKSPYSGVGDITVKYNGSDTPPVNAGTYTVTFDVAEGANFFGANGLALGTLTINKATPKATDFLTWTTRSADYTGSPVVITFAKPKSGAVGMGAVIQRYNGSTTAPTDAGTYTLRFGVAEGTNYRAVEEFAYAEYSGTLTIKKIDYDGEKTASATVRSEQNAAGLTMELPALHAGAAYGTATSSNPLVDASSISISGTTMTYDVTAQSDGTSAAITIPVTGAKNYNNYEVAVTITAKDRDDAGVSITGDNEITYGNAGFVLTARVTTPGTGTGTWEWDSSDKTVATVDNNGNVTILAAGTTTITAKYESDTTAGQATITVLVEPRTITEDDFTALPAVTKVYNASAQTQEVASSTLTKDVDYEIKYENNINAGTASYTITGKGNYDGTINKTFTIQKAVPTVSDVIVTAPTTVYTSTAIEDIELGFTDNPSGGSIQLDDGQTLEVGTKDYNWTYTPKDSDIANYSTVTGKVSITVQAAPVKPTITTNSLPNGRVGSAYNFTLKASGTGTITWSYTGTMPDGLDMDSDGKITGTPKTEETKTITVKAKNSEGEVTKDFTITILPKSSGGGGGGGGGVEAPITKYTLTYETNGGSAVAATKHDDGTTVNLTATPTKEGYSFDGWYADAALTSKITSVKMDGDKTVYAGWKEADKPTRPSNPFTDVAKGMYYYDAILWAINHDLQITSGTGATIFSPNATCTRGQIMTFLWRAAGRPEPMGNNNPFADVEADAYYYKAVMWALEKGFTKGTSATTFSPNAGCTRGQVMTFLYRYENAPILGGMANPFNDVARGAYYYDAVLWAVNHDPQITNGTNATTFSPDAICTRGQIVTFLYRDMNGK